MKRNALLIGLFVLVALALAAAGIAFLGGTRLFEQRTRAVVYFTNSVKGLYVGAPVTFRGVSIGQVDAIGIELDPDTLVTRIPVQLFLTSKLLHMSGKPEDRQLDVPMLVKRGLRARLAQQSVVTGQAMIDLDFNPSTPPTLHGRSPGSAEIPVVKGQFDDLVNQLGELPLKDTVADLRRTLAALNATAATARTVIAQAGDDWLVTSRATRELMQRTDRTLAAVGQEAGLTLQSVRGLSDTTRALVETTQPDIQLTLASTRQAAHSAEIGFQALADFAAPGSPPREDMEAALRDLSQTARSLRQVAELLENQPNALIFGRP